MPSYETPDGMRPYKFRSAKANSDSGYSSLSGSSSRTSGSIDGDTRHSTSSQPRSERYTRSRPSYSLHGTGSYRFSSTGSSRYSRQPREGGIIYSELENSEKESVWGYLVPMDRTFSPTMVLENLDICSPPLTGRSQSPKPKQYVVGRDAQCDLVVDNPHVSERQCIVCFDERKWRHTPMIHSLSNDGTFVNKTFLDPGDGRDLKDGDEISILDVVKCVFHTPEGYRSRVLKEQESKLDVEKSLNKGATFSTDARRNDTALVYASARGQDKLVQVLLDYGADAIGKNSEHLDRALINASRYGHTKIVKILLDRDAHVNGREDIWSNALFAASQGGHESIVDMLLAYGANVNAIVRPYGNALSVAAEEGHDNIVRKLLEQGADVNAAGGCCDNALTAASREGCDSIVKILLERGADINAAGGHDNPLLVASREGHESVVKMLLEAGMNVNHSEESSNSALIAASERGHENIVKLLLERGADVNVASKDRNALHAASKHGHEGIVKMLLEQGANVDAQVPQGDERPSQSELVQEPEKAEVYIGIPQEQSDDTQISLGTSSKFPSASITSGQTSVAALSLPDGCINAVLKHEIVVELGEAAASKIDRERFERNVGRLLELFFYGLYNEATLPTEKRAAKSLSATAFYVAGQITYHFYAGSRRPIEYSQAPEDGVSDMKIDVNEVKVDISDTKIPEQLNPEDEGQLLEAESESQSDSEAAVEAEANHAFDLTFEQMRTFILDGEPFKEFIANLQAFVDPPARDSNQNIKAIVKTTLDAMTLINDHQIYPVNYRPTYLDRQGVQPGSILYWNEGEVDYRQWKDGRRWKVLDEDENMITSEEIRSKTSAESDTGIRLIRRDFKLIDENGRVNHMISYLSKCDELNEHLVVPNVKPESCVKRNIAASQADITSSTPFIVALKNSLDRLTRRPPLPGKRRIEWTCSCGRRIYDDYTELQPGALDKLQVRLKKRANTLRPGETTIQSSRSVSAGLCTSIRSLVLSGFSKTSRRDQEELPSHNEPGAHCLRDTVTQPTSQPEVNHLLLLFPHRTHASKVDQPKSCGIGSDLEFFTRIKDRYKSLCYTVRSHLSLRALVEIRFVQFQLRPNDLANTLKLDSLPTAEESHNYDYKPKPPKIVPPIGSNEMLHYLDHPEDLPKDANMFSHVPKKLHQELSVCPEKGYSIGWGIKFIEGVSYERVSMLAFVSILIATIVAIIWAAVTRDAQTAFTVGTYVLMVLASAIGSLQTVLEK